MFKDLPLIRTQKEVEAIEISPDNRLFSANHDEIMRGLTTDIYFVKTREILEGLNLLNTPVVAEVFASGGGGMLAGIPEVKNMLAGRNVEVWALEEGDFFEEKEVVMRIIGTYDDFGIYETALLGILASSSGWATASRKIKDVVGDKTMVCFGARHVHPSVAPVMERAAIVGGADGASCILGAKLAGLEPSGTVPHAVFLIVGDTLKVAKAYKKFMPSGSPVIVLVDTFKDEAEEALRVAEALKEDLHSIRLDTPGERGGVTPGLVKELRARLDQAGHSHIKILVSGGLTPERIPGLIQAGVDSFGVGSYISGAAPIDMTMDLKEVNGRPIAKRGRIPGRSDAPRLRRIL
ncbi:nicotinate phosphoribosyltransferase [Desulfolucanica intricata]|uniref:nicotinate phosphoribosyltransferase n=1 Tax=Desulfolucanica intricata TaxID=1285191 RepID=UPI001EE42291|nr:nicotinate phosphoribosyltransferase [Desulfolucanica intricata]